MCIMTVVCGCDIVCVSVLEHLVCISVLSTLYILSAVTYANSVVPIPLQKCRHLKTCSALHVKFLGSAVLFM
jgi:hypothetical protein